jgi:predicted permease
VLQDLRFAVRLIAKERWFSAVAIVALMLGIGVNATVFTLVNAVLIRGLPFKDSGQLYMLSWQPGTGQRSNVSSAELEDWRAQVRTFSGLAAFSNTSLNISDDRSMPEQARGAWVTANAFNVLGQQPLLGRDFVPGEDRKGAEPVVMIGYSLWKNRYGADRNVLGRSVRLNGRPATIIGVMPENMKFPTNAELWAPFVPTTAQEKRDSRGLNVFGRLRNGATPAEALTELNAIAQRLATAYPDTNKDLVGVRVETFNERFNGGQIRVVFLAMMGAVGFVLLIACANVANLLLSRSAHRAREIALRIALGATRWRVIRQLLLESVVLGVIGGALGLLLALMGVRLFDAAVAETGKPYWIVFSIDYVVFGFLAAICVLSGVIFGLAPALHVTRTNINDVLKEGGRGTAGGRRARWLSSTMVVVELALTIVLLVGAGLMIRSFIKMYTLDIGIRTEHLMTMGVQLPDTKYATPESRRAFFERLEPRLAAIPGAEAVALTTSVPPFGFGSRAFEIDGRPAPKPDQQKRTVATVIISPRFFDVVGVQMRRGRTFHETDGAPGSETVIINERMAAQFFPGEDPMGKRLRFTERDPLPATPVPASPEQGRGARVWRTIVGISPSIRHSSPQDAEPTGVVYMPFRQDPPAFASLLVRSRLPPGSVMDAARREVQAIDQDQPVFTIQTLDQMLAQARWPFRVFGTLFVIFAVIALVLSSVGLYAVMAYSVTQRTQEIGVRMALGAEGRQVSWLILKRGLLQLAIGLTLGLAAAFGLSRVLQAILVQVAPTDPVTFASITILLTIVSITACLVPARRATRVDPLVALRE